MMKCECWFHREDIQSISSEYYVHGMTVAELLDAAASGYSEVDK